jgi:integrase
MQSKRRQKGTGTIRPYRHTDGSEDVTFYVQYPDASGRKIVEKVGRVSEGWTKAKVEDELRARINRVKKERWTKPKAMVFESYAERWLEEDGARRGWAKTTVKTYKCALGRLLPRFGTSKLADIRKAQVNDWIAEQLREGAEPRTVNLSVTVGIMIYKLALDEGLVDSNPFAGARRPKELRYKPRFLTVEEARAVESKLTDATVRFAFVTFETLGMRFAELRALRWCDVDFLNHRLRIEDSKTPEGERSLAIPPMLLAEFERHYQRSFYKADSDFIYCHPEKGSRMNPERYRDAVKAAFTAAGLKGKFRPAHDLRVTSLTSGVMANENVPILMARAGHTSYQTTKRYVDLAGQVFPDQAAALEALRFGVQTDTNGGAPVEVEGEPAA